MPPPESRRAGGGEPSSSVPEEMVSPSALTIILFGIFAAAVTKFVIKKPGNFSSWWDATGTSGRRRFKDEAEKQWYRRMQEEQEEETERVERIRRMQSVFNRERSKQKKTYESWQADGPGTYRHIPRDDWYWKADTSHKSQRTNFRVPPKESGCFALSHHYAVLGLDRSRVKPYSEAEIKMAFRAKAMECHPDQNQGNKEAAEVKFKEVMTSYEALKADRKKATD